MSKPVCIVTGIVHPLAAYTSLHNLLSIIESEGKKTEFFQSGVLLDFSSFKNVTNHWIPYTSPDIKIFRVFTFLYFQMRLSVQLIHYHHHFDSVILIFGSENFSIPLLVLKILRKRVILYYVSSQPKIYSFIHPELVFLFSCIQRVHNAVSDKIIVYSPNLINEWDFGKYRNKIVIAHEYFFKETFTVTLPFSDRPPRVGYIGRLSAEKGVQNLVRALPHILGIRKDLRVLIGGEGDLMESIQLSLAEEDFTDQVDLPGWISQDDLPQYLNQLQLLILPSYTEGLPTIMLQALACGTPVLATAVGAIPDIIRDGETGFIMRNNSPECIAENVIRVMSSQIRETVGQQGRRFVEEHFTFEKTRESLRPVINTL